SDLANLKTRAVRDGDTFVLNGQKVWTSGANYADFCFLFCRTDPDVPKHKGISIILLPMDTPGVTVRPLNEIVHPQHPDLNEVFLTDVVVPAANLVGKLNDGWAMANGSLAHERGMVWLMSVIDMEMGMQQMLELAPSILEALPEQERAVAADDVVRCYIESHAVRCLGYRGFARLVKGGSAPEQALMKLFASASRQRLARVAAEMRGPDALESKPQRSRRIGTLEDYFGIFGSTISAGSSEIQRNIIAERVLGLPRG
ncbi:MAG: acyl-CoA dehydrogenase, partial [Actinobacteria bacterium]|nr:acyl-CoA dehydrogenase [Actinomycetota bacterium]